MKRLFSRFSTRTKIVAATALAVVAIAIPMVAHAGFGPGRPTKVYNGPGTIGFSYPVFNSFTNVPGIGDERAFFTGMYPGGKVLTDPLAEVKDGDTLTLQVYVHNNADPSIGAKGTATGTTVRVKLPTAVSNSQEATAYIDATNTTPKEVYDTLDMGSKDGSAFQVQYVPGSAHIRGNYINTKLSDSVVTSGAKVGTVGLDGNVRGCFKQEVLVTLQVKIHVPHYSMYKKVNAELGTPNWKETETVSNGATVAWMIQFHNDATGTPVKGVKVVDQVPEGLTVTPGTVKLISSDFPQGYTYPDTAIQANGRQINVDIGDYIPNMTAYIVFRSTVPNLECGSKTLVNKAYVAPEGMGSLSDTASVTVNSGKNCQGPQFSCNALSADSLGDSKFRFTTDTTATNGATVKSYSYDFGDGSDALLTDAKSVEYTYTKTGTFPVSVGVTFTVNGVDQVVNSDLCKTTVTIKGSKPPKVTPPKELPNTGAGDIVGIFAATTVAGALAHKYWSKRLTRQ